MSHSSTSLPQLQAQLGKSPSSSLLSKPQAAIGPKGSAGQRLQDSSILPAIAGSARAQSPADVPSFFHGHTHAQAVATGQGATSEPLLAENARVSVLKGSVLAALQQSKEVEPDAIGSGPSDTRLRLFVKGVLPCFNPAIMEAYGAGVRDLGTASVDPDVASLPNDTFMYLFSISLDGNTVRRP